LNAARIAGVGFTFNHKNSYNVLVFTQIVHIILYNQDSPFILKRLVDVIVLKSVSGGRVYGFDRAVCGFRQRLEFDQQHKRYLVSFLWDV
jgi:hypothetical protein